MTKKTLRFNNSAFDRRGRSEQGKRGDLGKGGSIVGKEKEGTLILFKYG